MESEDQDSTGEENDSHAGEYGGRVADHDAGHYGGKHKLKRVDGRRKCETDKLKRDGDAEPPYES